MARARDLTNGTFLNRGNVRSHGLGTSIKYLQRTTSGAASNRQIRCQGLLTYPFTTSALNVPWLVRASFANKRSSSAEGWGLGDKCLCMELRLPPFVHKHNPHQRTFSFASAAQDNIPV